MDGESERLKARARERERERERKGEPGKRDRGNMKGDARRLDETVLPNQVALCIRSFRHPLVGGSIRGTTERTRGLPPRSRRFLNRIILENAFIGRH